MARQMMALCDSQASFGERLADYLEKQVGFPYSVMLFTDLGELVSYGSVRHYSEEELRYVILSEDMLEEYECDECVRKTYVLTESEEVLPSKDIRYQFIYRYQSAGSIMRQILSGIDSRPQVQTQKVRIIGAFHPTGRCMQTSFLIALGQILSRERRTLYINLEGFSGFRELMGKEYRPDITDFVYYLRRGSSDISQKLEQMIVSLPGLEMIPPANNFSDLMSINPDEIVQLMSSLRENGAFGYILIDLSEYIRGVPEILKRCDLVFFFEQEDEMGKAKQIEFEKALESMGYGDILHKVKRVKLSSLPIEETRFERLQYSQLGQVARSVVKEEFGIGSDSGEEAGR